RLRVAAAQRAVPVPARRRRLHALLLAGAVRQPARGRPHLRGARLRPVRQRRRQPGDLHLDGRRDRSGPHIASAGGANPVVQGTAGTSAGDDGSVRLDLYSGGAPSGSPGQSIVVARDGSGAFSGRFDHVTGGTYTVVARQGDAAGNSGSSAPVSFTVGGGAVQAPPDFALFAMDESLADAASGRLTALSSCEGACSRTTSLSVSSRVAKQLGLPRRGSRPVRLGGSRRSGGAGAVKV